MGAVGGGINDSSVQTPAPTTFEELWSNLKARGVEFWHTIEADAKAAEVRIVPILEADLVGIFSQFIGVAQSLIVKFASAEYDVLTGAQKQSNVATLLAESMQSAGHDIMAIGMTAVTGFVKQTFDALAVTKPQAT